MNQVKTYKLHGMPIAQFLPFRLPSGRSGKIEITTKLHPSESILTVTSLKNSIFMHMPPARVKLGEPTISHHLTEDDQGVWMTSLPQEVEQCTRQLKDAHGNVLLGGLGLGLAVGLLQLNPKVNHITAVEINKDVLKLVKPYLPRKHPLVLIRDNIKAFLRAARKYRKKYDFAFYDTWQLTGEHNLVNHVMPLRELSIDIVEQRYIQCWNEEEMIGKVHMTLQNMIDMERSSLPQHQPMRTSLWSEEQFNEFRPVSKGLWPFLNWFRQVKPSVAEALNRIPDYLDAIRDANRWKADWRKWEKEVKHATA